VTKQSLGVHGLLKWGSRQATVVTAQTTPENLSRQPSRTRRPTTHIRDPSGGSTDSGLPENAAQVLFGTMNPGIDSSCPDQRQQTFDTSTLMLPHFAECCAIRAERSPPTILRQVPNLVAQPAEATQRQLPGPSARATPSAAYAPTWSLRRDSLRLPSDEAAQDSRLGFRTLLLGRLGSFPMDSGPRAGQCSSISELSSCAANCLSWGFMAGVLWGYPAGSQRPRPVCIGWWDSNPRVIGRVKSGSAVRR
jgi:hypothetical protein